MKAIRASPRTEFYYYYQQNALEAVQTTSEACPSAYRTTYRGLKPGSDGWLDPLRKDQKAELYDLRCDPVNGMMFPLCIPKR
jgi:hypothetical protein